MLYLGIKNINKYLFREQLGEGAGLSRQELPAVMPDKGRWDKLIKWC